MGQMKRQKKFLRVISGILSAAIMLCALPLGMVITGHAATPDAPTELSELSDYLHASVTVTDNNVGLTANVHTYYDAGKTYTVSNFGKPGTPTILYVMNTNTERLGKKSDAEIVKSLLERDFFVIVVDYMNNPEAVSPALDWSLQDLRAQVIGGSSYTGKGYTSGTFTDGKLRGANQTTAISYILPSGYDIAYEIPYFSYDQYGSAGILERIVEIWNNDFKSVHRRKIVKWVDDNGLPRLDRTEALTIKSPNDTVNTDYATWFKNADGSGAISQSALAKLSADKQKEYPYTYIGNTKVQDITDCKKPDGSFIDLNLYMDFIYPTDDTISVPVMVCASSTYTRAGSWTSATRPFLTGFLFSGYAGVLSDFALVPMCRDDHYGYFCGNSQVNSVSGDNYTYSLFLHCGVESDTAMVRTIRKVGTDGLNGLKLNLNVNKIGAYGNSKAGMITRLGMQHPELDSNQTILEGHADETRFEALNDPTYGYKDPYVTSDGKTTTPLIRLPEEQPCLTYDNGDPIPSNINLVYANCGALAHTIVEGGAPMFGAGTQKLTAAYDNCSYWAFYRDIFSYAKSADVPFFGVVAPSAGHDFAHGTDKDYGIDTYWAFHRYADYWLGSGNAECVVIDVDTTSYIGIASDVPIDNIYEINENSSIKLQFTGSVSRDEIQRVTVTDTTTGKALTGEWTSIFAGCQWKFVPYDIEDGRYYRVNVPADLTTENGHTLKEGKSLLFRTTGGLTESAEISSGGSITSESGAYVAFPEADYSAADDLVLRFAVSNDAVNTVGIYAINSFNEENPEASTVGKKLGSVIVLGRGVYGFDVSDYVKSVTGRPAFRLLAESASEDILLNEYNMNNGTPSGVWFSYFNKVSTSTDIPSEDGSENKSLKWEYRVRSSNYIDLNGDLNGNNCSDPTYIGSVNYGFGLKPFKETDAGRSFIFTFKVYDETSRVLSINVGRAVNKEDKHANIDGEGMASFTTKAGEWTTITMKVTLPPVNMHNLLNLDRYAINIQCENRSVATLDKFTTVNTGGMTQPTASRPSYYAGDAGLNDKYTNYKNAADAEKAGKVTVNEEHTYAIYFDDFTFTEIKTDVTLAGAPTLAMKPREVSDTLPVLSTYVSSETPDTSFDGSDLVVGGGESGFDTVSVKTYLKFSLEDYTGAIAALVLRAAGAGTVSVYGIADVAAGQEWTNEDINYNNAPANDIYSSGVLLSAVYGNEAIDSFTSTETQSVHVIDFTAFARAMSAKGAKAVTLAIVTTDGASVTLSVTEKTPDTLISSYDFGKQKPSIYFTGYDVPTDKQIGRYNDGAIEMHPGYARNFANGGQNIQIRELLDPLWRDKSYIGKTVRVVFTAKGTAPGVVSIGLSTNAHSYTYKNGAATGASLMWSRFPGTAADISVTNEYKKFTLEFKVTEDMYPDKLMTEDGTKASGASLSLCFNFVSLKTAGNYNDPDFTLSVSDAKVIIPTGETVTQYTDEYDFSIRETSVWRRGYGLKNSNNEMYYYLKESGDLVIDLARADNCNPNQNIILNEIFNPIFNDSRNVGNTYTVTFRAKATVDGTVDLALGTQNPAYPGGKSDGFTASSGLLFNPYPGSTSTIALTSDYKEFTYTFTVTEEMLPSNLMTTEGGTQPIDYCLGLALRFYNGFGMSSYYKNAAIYINGLSIVQKVNVDRSTLPMEASRAVSYDSVSENLTAVANPTPAERGDVKRAYIYYELPADKETVHAMLRLNAKTATGETVTLYALPGVTAPSSLTYGTAVPPSGKALATFTLLPGETAVDVSDYVIEHKGERVVFILAIERAGKDVVIDNTATVPTLRVLSEPDTGDDLDGMKIEETHSSGSLIERSFLLEKNSSLRDVAINDIGTPVNALTTVTLGGKEYYELPVSLDPADAWKSYTVSVTLDTGTKRKSMTASYSLSDTAKGIISSGADEASIAAAKDTLLYVRSAMTYFGTATEESIKEINEILGADYGKDITPGSLGLPSAVKSDSGKRITGISLDIKNKPTFVFYLSAADISVAESFRVTVDGREVKTTLAAIEESGARIEAELDLADFAKTLSFSYTDESGATQSGKYNLAAYLASAPAAADPALYTLALVAGKYAKGN